MKAMILAAGKGERLLPLTATTPKPLLKIQGKPLIEYHIEYLAKIGITDIVINLHYLSEQIQAYLDNKFKINIHYSVEPQLLNTGGGIKKALPLLGSDPFLVISADIYTQYPFEKLLNYPVQLGHLILAANPDFRPQGDYDLKESKVIQVAQPPYTYCSMGLFHPEILSSFADNTPFPFHLAFERAIKQQALTGEVYTGPWVNVGTVQQLDVLNNKIS